MMSSSFPLWQTPERSPMPSLDTSFHSFQNKPVLITLWRPNTLRLSNAFGDMRWPIQCSGQLSRVTPWQLHQPQINCARADVRGSFNIWSFFNRPHSMDFTERRSDLQIKYRSTGIYMFPVDKFMYSFIFINSGNPNLYLFRWIHSSSMLRTLNDNIYHASSNACCSRITTGNYYNDFYLPPKKLMLLLTWAKARKLKYVFHPYEYDLKHN